MYIYASILITLFRPIAAARNGCESATERQDPTGDAGESSVHARHMVDCALCRHGHCHSHPVYSGHVTAAQLK